MLITLWAFYTRMYYACNIADILHKTVQEATMTWNKVNIKNNLLTLLCISARLLDFQSCTNMVHSNIPEVHLRHHFHLFNSNLQLIHIDHNSYYSWNTNNSKLFVRFFMFVLYVHIIHSRIVGIPTLHFKLYTL